jgi:hypothetical protein
MFGTVTSKPRFNRWRLAAFALALVMAAPVSAINIEFDYTYDTTDFFGAGNPSGATAGEQALAALEAVGEFYSTILTDTFSSIQTPANYASEQFNGVAFWNWSLDFSHPSTGGDLSLQNQNIAANEYRIYAGARELGSTLGIGGPGGYQLNSNNNGGGFTQNEITEIEAIHEAFEDDVIRREETSGFARWGGAITFDRFGTNWHYNHTTAPTGGKSDFFSVAVHELGHALGLGASAEWNALVVAGTFRGLEATSEYGSHPPVTGGHWASGTMSRVYGTNTPQEAAMDPEVTGGTRKRLTALDAEALDDIGWDVAAAPVNFNPADFNEDMFVNGGDLTVWRNAFGINPNGDADADGDSDGRDFLIWQRQLGASSLSATALSASASVPEPPSALLALAAFAALRAACRCRLGQSPT